MEVPTRQSKKTSIHMRAHKTLPGSRQVFCAVFIIMKNTENRKPYFYRNGFQAKLQAIYDEEAEQALINYNSSYPDSKLIYHGCYPRTVFAWDEHEEEYFPITLTVTRLRVKGTNKTYTYQGSILAPHSKYLKHQMMELLADYIMRKGHDSIEAESNYREMSIAAFRRWLSAFVGFLKEISEKYASLQDAIRDLFSLAVSMEDYIYLYRRVGKFPIVGPFSSASIAGLHAPAVE